MRSLVLGCALLLVAGACQGAKEAAEVAEYSAEEITFRSGPFKVVGDLRLPKEAGPHPVVVFVHGDGPNDRTSGVTYPPIMARMLRAGYATFAWDKPGTGESTGKIDPGRTIEQRAQIVHDAVDVLKSREDVDAGQIGLWGISQAGYVMPAVLSTSDDIAFMIAISCPGEPGVEQGAYLVTAQARCAGLSEDDAESMEYHVGAVEWATTYDEYVRHKRALVAMPAFRALEAQGVYVGVRPREDWHEPDLDGAYFSDPMDVIERTKIPILSVFGELDTQADPVQGAEAYREAMKRGGNPHSRVELVPGTDHNIILSATGCIEERESRTAEGWRNYPQVYLDLIEEWLLELRYRPGAGGTERPIG